MEEDFQQVNYHTPGASGFVLGVSPADRGLILLGHALPDSAAHAFNKPGQSPAPLSQGPGMQGGPLTALGPQGFCLVPREGATDFLLSPDPQAERLLPSCPCGTLSCP